jgi:TetR/AcrR family transcriptional regulator, mexJK operon transcriptional repressor
LHFICVSLTVLPMEKELASPPAKSPGRPRAADLEARSQNLIDTAGRLFLEMGYSKVSLELIAREAHVAVRTIYVKFGGKAGLFKAVLLANRDKFIASQQMESDTRPLRTVLGEFGLHFLALITAPDALAAQRMVIAEAQTNPELAHSFFDAGPRETREMLGRYFNRPDVRAQLRDDLQMELIPSYLIQCVMGDPFSRFLFDPAQQPQAEVERLLQLRLALFYRSVLK